MTMTRTLASALVAFASLATVSTAGAVVPGSDTYERAQENAAVQSVITGQAAGRVGALPGEARTFGYPNAGAADGRLVPGSSYFNDAADARSLNSVIRGVPEGVVRAAPSSSGRLVPGSDSF